MTSESDRLRAQYEGAIAVLDALAEAHEDGDPTPPQVIARSVADDIGRRLARTQLAEEHARTAHLARARSSWGRPA